MSFVFRKATSHDLVDILPIIDQAKANLKAQGLDQWQGSYPSFVDIRKDIEYGQAYLLIDLGEESAEETGTEVDESLPVNEKIAGYFAVKFGNDPIYNEISEGSWLIETTKYVLANRIAFSDDYRGHGLSKEIFAEIFRLGRENGVRDYRISTLEDNKIMCHIFEREGFQKRGYVYNHGPRVAYERIY